MRKILENWKSGLTVALVSIPLSISLAVASGANPVAGIITAVWAGMVAAILGGSNFNIVGPAGALSAILVTYVTSHGASALPLLAMVTGGFILMAWVLRLEKYLVFVPASVVHGFTLGVAITIARGQFASAFEAKIIFLSCLALLFIFNNLFKKVPAAVLVAGLGIILGLFAHFPIVKLVDQFPKLQMQLFTKLTWDYDASLWTTGIIVAIIAILETMLSARVADGMTATKHDKRQELFGLGLANIVSGLAGGLPATAVLARTALNIKSGANHKASAFINAVCVAVISLFLFTYFQFIPMATIAAILVFVAIRMVDIEHFKHLWKSDRSGFILALLVAGVTVFEDPLLAIALGAAISLLILIEKISHGQYELALNHMQKGQVFFTHNPKDDLEKLKIDASTVVYSIKGELVHFNGHAHLARFERGLNGYKNIVLRLRELYFMDIDGSECLSEIITLLQSQNRTVVLTGMSGFISTMLEKNPEYIGLKKQGLVFEKTAQALKFLGHNTR